MLALVVLSILFSWLVCAAVCIGIGSLVLRGFRFPFSPLDALWTGIANIVLVLVIYHFFWPIELSAVILLLGLALIGWLWSRVSLFQKLQELKNNQLWAILHYFPAAAIIAFRAAGPCEHYDTGLYGATAIRWITTYPVVPGLGNLLGQFGFNSSVHLWMAVLDQGPLRGLAHHLFVGFLIAALFASQEPKPSAGLKKLATAAILPLGQLLSRSRHQPFEDCRVRKSTGVFYALLILDGEAELNR